MTDLPADYKAEPRPYKGQTRRNKSDDLTIGHDLSNPDENSMQREPMDVLDADRPVGAQSSDPIEAKSEPKIRWFR